jgi:nitrate/nitrite transport system ATP-binding protein
VSRLWAERHPNTHIALVRALLDACALCDDPAYRATKLPDLLAGPDFVGGSAQDFIPALSGAFDLGEGRERAIDDFIVFSKNSANLTRRNESHWILAQMVRWGMLQYPEAVPSFIEGIFGDGTLRQAAALSDRMLAAQDSSALQVDGFAFDLQAPFDYLNALQIRRDKTPPSQPGPTVQDGKVVAA